MKITESVRGASVVAAQVAVPLCMVLGIRMMTLDGGPARASAAATPTPTLEMPAPVAEEPGMDELTSRQVAEAGRVATLPIERDPFWSRAFASEDPSTVALAPLPGMPGDETPKPAQLPSLKFTSVASGRETVAVINGKVCRVGDQVAPEWTLFEIDPSSNTVTVEHATGQRETVTLSR
ncbi:MAG: general secretion pathway protein GspB [Phycisphaerales bacterium]|nr:general secretion pathway protein GspB [Phycisphaerales bacterium]